MRTAYLVGFIDVRTTPPRYKGCGIFSEPTPSVEGFPFPILDAEGAKFEDAVEVLKGYLEDKRLAWAKSSLKE